MPMEQGLPPQFDVMVRQIVVDDAGTVCVAAGSELFASDDNGASWQRLAVGLPATQAGGGAEFQRLGLLLSGNVQSLLETTFRT